MGDPPKLADIEAALAAVGKTLDALTAAGQNEKAFELARAQYAASIRHSWPGNLGTLAAHLEKLCADPGVSLSAEHREELGRAAAVFRQIRHG
jgi:hypothetical protein